MIHTTDDSDAPDETPPSVIGAIAAAVGPLPFLVVYAVVFIGHGVFYPVQPPDITKSRTGEAIAGFTAVALSLVLILTIWWFLSGRRRWPFVLAQLAVLGTTIAFITDPNTGSATVPLVLVVTSVVALVLAFAHGSNEFMGSGWAPRLSARRSYRGARRVTPSVQAQLPAGVQGPASGSAASREDVSV